MASCSFARVKNALLCPPNWMLHSVPDPCAPFLMHVSYCVTVIQFRAIAAASNGPGKGNLLTGVMGGDSCVPFQEAVVGKDRTCETKAYQSIH